MWLIEVLYHLGTGLLDMIRSRESCIPNEVERLKSYKPIKSKKGTGIVAYRGVVRSGKRVS